MKQLYSRLLLLALCLYTVPLAAQTGNRHHDSLLVVYNKTKTFKAKLETGNELIFVLRFDHKPLAKKIALGLLNDPRIAQYPEDHSRAWIRLGIVYDLSSKADSAILCNEKALEIANQHQLSKQKASALNNLGLIYWNYLQLDKATDYITKASEVFEQIKDTVNLANALNNLGLIMNEFTFREKAATYHRKAYSLFKAMNDEYGMGSALHNIAFSQRNTDSARYYYYKTIAWQKRIHDVYGLGKTFNDLAIVYSRGKNKDSTLHYFHLSIDYHKQAGNLYGQTSAMFSLASYLFRDLGELDQSLDLALESSRIAQETGNTKFFWKAELVVAVIYYDRKEYQKAAFHFNRTVNLKDSVMNEDNLRTSQQLELKYSVSQKEKLLAEQKADLSHKEKLIAEGESEKKTMWIILIIIAAAAVVLLGGLGWYFNRKRLRRQREHAQLLAEEREKSLQQNLLGQEEERQRIAKDLHDGIVQELAAIKMNLEQINPSTIPQEQQKNIDQVRQSLEKTTKEVREISHQMMPTALRKLGLVAALEDNLQKVLGPHQIKYDFFSRGINGRLPEKIEISLYRITQELINNVIKHSGASQVSISLTLLNGFVTMHFEDNGKGFDASKKSGGIGLTNLQSRVRIVNGEIKYETAEGSGTVAIIRVPV